MSAKWVWKKPYTTHTKYFSITTFEDVIAEFKKLKEKWQYMIPYIFLQAYLKNHMEYNVVCLNGVALYEARIANRTVSNKGKEKFENRNIRKVFAETVISTLVRNRPESLISGLFRVDIMYCTYLNKMVVLELESLEAVHYAVTTDFTVESQLHAYLGVYHANNIISCLKDVLKVEIPLLNYPVVNISSQYAK